MQNQYNSTQHYRAQLVQYFPVYRNSCQEDKQCTGQKQSAYFGCCKFHWDMGIDRLMMCPKGRSILHTQ